MTAADPKRSVLVVDDEAFVLQTTTFILRRLGFEHVLTAQQPAEAMRLLDAADPPVGLILTDLNMPDMDGVELLRHFDERGFKGDIVLLSGEDSRTLSLAENLAKARKLSVLGAIAKPLQLDRLAALLAQRDLARCAPAHASPRQVSAERLRSAIETGELEPWYQPKIKVADRQVVGVEALVRWPSATEGMIYPDAFIPVAEANGLIDPLTFLVIEKVIGMSACWRKQGVELKVAVNVSMDSLYDLSFPEALGRYLKTGANAVPDLQIEVTESRLMEDLVRPLDVLLRLRMRKIRLSIDDFGIGHSNLSQLRDLPFDEIKIDRSYVQGAGHDPNARTILEATVDMARKLNMTIVAEGVETLADWQRIERLGCDQAQGYFIARPMPGDEIPEWVATWPARSQSLFS